MRRSGAHGTNPQSRFYGAIVLLRQDIVKDTPVPDVVKSLDLLENETVYSGASRSGWASCGAASIPQGDPGKRRDR